MKSESQDQIQLLLEWGSPEERPRALKAATASVLGHVLMAVILLNFPVFEAGVPQRLPDTLDRQRVTPLILPPRELTQPDPNRGKISREFTADSLLPRPRLLVPPARIPSGRPAPALEPPQIEAPVVAQQQAVPPGSGMAGLSQPPPPPPLVQPEKPKIAFESVGSQGLSNIAGPGTGSSKVPLPGSSVDDAMKSVIRSGRAGGLVIGDAGEGTGGFGEGLNLPPSPGRVGSSLELLSDPLGVDFRPYLIRVLSAVRRNWFAVMPESAKFGRRGKTVIQFAIARDGRVPKLVISVPSGADALDRAAVAGISASNPFPPLPPDFKGDQVRLQLNFLYNLR